jgi:hypothetical protein
MIRLVTCVFLAFFATTGAPQPVEEILVHGPMDFHNTAMNTFLEMRRQNPNENLTSDGNFLQRANEHAVKRMRRRPDDELSMKVLISFRMN